MGNRRLNRMMQESLDDQLSSEAKRELQNRLRDDYWADDEYGRLRRVDSRLKAAPHAKVAQPNTLVQSILAKARGLNPHHLPHLPGLALALGLAGMALVALPFCVITGYVLLSLFGNAAGLGNLIFSIVVGATMAMSALDAVSLLLRDTLGDYALVWVVAGLSPVLLLLPAVRRFRAMSAPRSRLT